MDLVLEETTGVEQLGWRNGNFSMHRALAALSGALELHRTAEVAA